MDDDQQADQRALYVISVAAELAGVHPQTLRIYERKGLIEPRRTDGRSVCGWTPASSAATEMM